MNKSHDTHIPLHAHEENTFNYILEGDIKLGFENEPRREYGKGDWIFINKSTKHSLRARKESLILELWEK